MSKIGAYQPPDKYKNYTQATTKPFKSHMYYQEKVWTLPEQIYKKLKTVAELLEELYPKITDDFSKNIHATIDKNLQVLLGDLDFLRRGLDKDPRSFNTNKLKVNQSHIHEMKKVCDNLQTISSYEYNFKKAGKIKHALHELEHLLQPTSNIKDLKMAPVKSLPKKAPVKKAKAAIGEKKKTTKAPLAKPKKAKTASKPLKPIKKALKPAPKKAKAPVHKTKAPVKTPAKPKSKLSVKPKKTAAPKPKKPVAVKAKPKAKSASVTKKK